MNSTKRKKGKHTVFTTDELLNNLSPEDAAKALAPEIKKAVPYRGCLLSKSKERPGYYPRYTFTLDIAEKLLDEVLRDKVVARITGLPLGTRPGDKQPNGEPVAPESVKGKIRVSLFALAYRAAGHVVPVYESGLDIAHICRNGTLNKRNSLDSKSVDLWTFGKGCFNASCLEVVTHGENLSQGKCVPIKQCVYCELYYEECEHQTRCGTSSHLEDGMDGQEAVEFITVTYTDGSKKTVCMNEAARLKILQTPLGDRFKGSL